MNCPNCGAPEQARVRVCASCGQAYASQDLLELRQLEFLLQATVSWGVSDALRIPYQERLHRLRERLRPAPPAPAAEAPPATPAPAVAPPPPRPAPPPAPPKPAREKVPFDQWLLSDRNIKIALYTGGLLLVLAGLIFIGVNWTRIPGPGKFAITLLMTGLMYLGGFSLYGRPAYRLGGAALLGVASAFVALDSAVLHIYVLAPRGLSDAMMWLIASPFCLLLYSATAVWTRSEVFTYLSLAAVGSTVTAALQVGSAPELAYPLTYALLAYALLAFARVVEGASIAPFTRQPVYWVSHLAMPVVLLAALVGWGVVGVCSSCSVGSPWLAVATLAVGALFYATAAYWSRSQVFTFFALAALAGTVLSGLQVVSAPELVFPLVFSLLTTVLLVFAWAVEGTALASFTRAPLDLASQCAMPFVLLAGFVGWNLAEGCRTCSLGSPWLAIATLGVGVLFYVTGDAAFHRRVMRWPSALLFALTFALTLSELRVSDTAAALALMALAAAYQGIGYALERAEGQRSGGWPLYATGYLVAAFVTLQAIGDTADLAHMLMGDVVLLVLSAVIQREARWAYAAVWLLMLPAYLYITLFEPEITNQGLLMGLLGLNYAAFGYALGRRASRLAWPFLSAGAFLSVLTGAMTWGDPRINSLVWAAVAVLYVLAALWRTRPSLLAPALLAVNLGAFSLNRHWFGSGAAWEEPLTLSFAALGLLLTLGGVILRRKVGRGWHVPLFAFGASDSVIAYLGGLDQGGWIGVGLSAVFGAALLALAWSELEAFVRQGYPPLLTYLGAGLLFVGHFQLLQTVGGAAWENWPFFSAILCAVFLGLSWAMGKDALGRIYGTPFRHAGLALTVVPLMGSIALDEPLLIASSFGVVGLAYALEAWLRRHVVIAYLSLACAVVVVWALLAHWGVTERQAYVIPAGLALLGAGWNERRARRSATYRLATGLGLVLLMGSALVQSAPRGSYGYAFLLLVESLLAVGWGMWTRSRGYVRWGGLALIADAFVQFGPAFVEFPRWVQLGLTGGILLGAGLAALFRREQILRLRKQVIEEWRSWEP